jgi:hypothetical protein
MCVWSSRPFAWRFGPAGWRKVKKGKEEKRASDSRDSNKIASNVGFPFLYLRPPIFLLFTEIGYFLSLQHFYQVVYLFGFSHHRNRMKRGSGEEGKKKNVRGEKNKKEKSSKLRNEVSIWCVLHCTQFSLPYLPFLPDYNPTSFYTNLFSLPHPLKLAAATAVCTTPTTTNHLAGRVMQIEISMSTLGGPKEKQHKALIFF